MKLFMDYGRKVAVLPATLLAHVSKATKKDISFLLALSLNPAAMQNFEAERGALAAATRMTEAEIDASLAFWRGTGLLGQADGDEVTATATEAVATAEALTTTEAPARTPTPRASYSAEELAGILERRTELPSLVDACQQAFGKIFNTGEVEIIAFMVDFLGFDGDFVLLLISHCHRMGKRSMRYVEKTAIGLFDDGVTTVEALQERLRYIEQMSEIEGRIRAMFGFGSRALTSRERAAVEDWICRMQMPDELIKRAYEITVDSTGKATIAYANSILKKWHDAGYKTLEDVEREQSKHKAKKKAESLGALDVNEFLDAAIKRTYSEG